MNLKNLLMTGFLLAWGQLIAQGEDVQLKYWDGTFAYNTLEIKSSVHEPTLNVILSGSTLGLGGQISGSDHKWGEDKLELSLSMKDCEIDLTEKIISCSRDQVYGSLSWKVNHRMTKTYTGLFKNFKLFGNKQEFGVSFEVKEDKYFKPGQELMETTIQILM